LDNLTHTLFAATLAQTRLRQAGRGTLATLVLASNAPDVDIVTAFIGGGPAYLAMHRGPTHGPLGIATLAVASAALVRLARTDAHFGRLVGVAFAGVGLHVLMDLPTSYGTRFLSPFSEMWFALDWLPIIDVYLLALLIAGLAWMRWRPVSHTRPAAAVLSLVLLHYGLRFAAHETAIRRWRTPPDAGGSEPACAQRFVERWPSSGRFAREACRRIHAIPTFTSPSRWRVIHRYPDGYLIREVDLVRPWSESLAVKTEWNDWAERAAATEIGRTFLAFARLPVVTVEASTTGRVVRLSDVRFLGGPLRLASPGRMGPRTFFTAVVTLAPDGRVVGESLGAP
jgi:membrane-bound metal-dependent hydrolase YbcI (DUF457 family)